jgi:hypothetical protein
VAHYEKGRRDRKRKRDLALMISGNVWALGAFRLTLIATMPNKSTWGQGTDWDAGGRMELGRVAYLDGGSGGIPVVDGWA